MALRFAGKLSNNLLEALLRVIAQEGWDGAKEWLRTRGVHAERVA